MRKMVPTTGEEQKGFLLTILVCHGNGSWSLALEKWLGNIHHEFPMMNLFVVGHRTEERPAVAEFGNALSGSAATGWSKCLSLLHMASLEECPSQARLCWWVEGESHRFIFVSIKDLSLKWDKVATFQNGSKVHLLKCSVRD